LVPLVATQRGVAVVASRRDLRWPNFSLRRRLVEQDLSPFSNQETERQLGGEADADISSLAQAVHGLTGGLPGASQFVIDRLAATNQLTVNAPALLGTLVDDYLFREQSGPPKEAITAVSPLPSFGYVLLNRVLTKINPKTPERRTREIIDIAEQMEVTGHVNWSSEKKGFRVNPGAAGIMTKLLKATDRKTYRDILLTGIEFYNAIREKSSSLENPPPEDLYNLQALLAKEAAEATSVSPPAPGV